MVDPLIFPHVVLGDATAVTAIWIIVELLDPTQKRVNRAALVSLLGVTLAWLVYLIGGYYYVVSYPPVRDVIKVGAWDWAHKIFMEAKEHIFLLGPYLMTTIAVSLNVNKERLLTDDRGRKMVIALSLIMVIGAATMLLMGVMISTGYRVALGG
ncbi:MAG: hypothetical protein H3Z52_03535 [archaeon]|nr:hypothetical protein [archaeon]MCP8318037.1 hypothetical protein [archaeon]MCP8320002.1 hypothetical protein [archaeon]